MVKPEIHQFSPDKMSDKIMKACNATEMIPTMEMISATEMTPNHHRNDPLHRNDTGGNHRNDPWNIGNGIKRTTKTGQQCRLPLYLFILHLFYGV